jgi:hypothetical protein
VKAAGPFENPPTTIQLVHTGSAWGQSGGQAPVRVLTPLRLDHPTDLGRANWREATVPGCDSPVASRVGCRECAQAARTEQWKSGEDLLQMHHLTRYELGDGEGDNLGRTVDISDHAARFRGGEATAIGA